jgi:hypothetical protein
VPCPDIWIDAAGADSSECEGATRASGMDERMVAGDSWVFTKLLTKPIP